MLHFAGFNWIFFLGGIGVVTILVLLFSGKELANNMRVLIGSVLFTLVWITGLYSFGPQHQYAFIGMLVALCLFLTVANWAKRLNTSMVGAVCLICRTLVPHRKSSNRKPR